MPNAHLCKAGHRHPGPGARHRAGGQGRSGGTAGQLHPFPHRPGARGATGRPRAARALVGPSAFSPREIDVPRLLAGGWDTVEVACRLHYSGRTIKSVITSMMNRLDLRKRSHAVAYALRCKLL
ncbi:helix-turn-helix transcriptional regulator [Streptomyces sp. NPDC056352]|uniref:helix-turn-helix domain-containing protein n=1 Tax=Streptomyces sp. NPDC056352 TaxID=3345791 RepID=UPI0035E3B745